MLWHGALAAALATLVGHYPWFLTHNSLSTLLGARAASAPGSALIGLLASLVSDLVSNSVRVVKTIRQTQAEAVGYRAVVAGVVAREGPAGLLCRGLGTKLLVGALQGTTFAVLWRYFQQK